LSERLLVGPTELSREQPPIMATRAVSASSPKIVQKRFILTSNNVFK
jgi:hypothetical protein